MPTSTLINSHIMNKLSTFNIYTLKLELIGNIKSVWKCSHFKLICTMKILQRSCDDSGTVA